MAQNIFSPSVLKSIGKVFSENIKNAVLGSGALKKEINKTLQQANRRLQNIEKAGLASPAAKAVIAERGKKNYTYFSVSGLNPTNETDWEKMKYEYGRALSFLNNPTSTASGARQYIKYQSKELRIPFESANKIVDIATSPTIDEYGNVNIFSYGNILDRYKNDVKKVGDVMEKNAKEYADELENALMNALNKTMNDSFLDRFF